MKVSKQRNVASRQPEKDIDCPASINFRLETPASKDFSAREDKVNFPLWLEINFQHNHSLTRADYLRFLTVSESTKHDFDEMFRQGLTPAAAHAELRRKLKIDYPNTWPMVCADRSRFPNIIWVYYWHRTFMDREFGSRDGCDVVKKAEDLIAEFNKKCKEDVGGEEDFAAIAQTEDGQTAIVIVDPLMRRVHKNVLQSGEICLIDATSNLDR